MMHCFARPNQYHATGYVLTIQMDQQSGSEGFKATQATDLQLDSGVKEMLSCFVDAFTEDIVMAAGWRQREAGGAVGTGGSPSLCKPIPAAKVESHARTVYLLFICQMPCICCSRQSTLPSAGARLQTGAGRACAAGECGAGSSACGTGQSC